MSTRKKLQEIFSFHEFKANAVVLVWTYTWCPRSLHTYSKKHSLTPIVLTSLEYWMHVFKNETSLSSSWVTCLRFNHLEMSFSLGEIETFVAKGFSQFFILVRSIQATNNISQKPQWWEDWLHLYPFLVQHHEHKRLCQPWHFWRQLDKRGWNVIWKNSDQCAWWGFIRLTIQSYSRFWKSVLVYQEKKQHKGHLKERIRKWITTDEFIVSVRGVSVCVYKEMAIL